MKVTIEGYRDIWRAQFDCGDFHVVANGDSRKAAAVRLSRRLTEFMNEFHRGAVEAMGQIGEIVE